VSAADCRRLFSVMSNLVIGFPYAHRQQV
jgi:hypothetical protein